jgi:hypothetical protein
MRADIARLERPGRPGWDEETVLAQRMARIDDAEQRAAALRGQRRERDVVSDRDPRPRVAAEQVAHASGDPWVHGPRDGRPQEVDLVARES